MLCDDFFFYLTHRTLHLPRIYPHIHKIHHEHKVTICIAAQYAHPIEFIFGNCLTIATGPFILGKRMHLVTLLTWYAIRGVESVEGHSGYEFPWSPFRIVPFAVDDAYHAFHHSANIGNYSSFFTIWDTVWGSNKEYYTFLDQKEKEHLKT